MKLLHIDSSVLGPHSVSRQVSRHRGRLRQSTPGFRSATRPDADTAGESVGIAFAAGRAPRPRHRCSRNLAAGQAVLKSFLGRRHPSYSVAPCIISSIPSQLKAWIDRVLVAGKTFKYDARVSMGCRQHAAHRRDLARRLLRPGTPAAVANISKPICAGVRFIGVSNPESISARKSRSAPSIARRRRGGLASREQSQRR